MSSAVVTHLKWQKVGQNNLLQWLLYNYPLGTVHSDRQYSAELLRKPSPQPHSSHFANSQSVNPTYSRGRPVPGGGRESIEMVSEPSPPSGPTPLDLTPLGPTHLCPVPLGPIPLDHTPPRPNPLDLEDYWECTKCLNVMPLSYVFCDTCGRDRFDTASTVMTEPAHPFGPTPHPGGWADTTELVGKPSTQTPLIVEVSKVTADSPVTPTEARPHPQDDSVGGLSGSGYGVTTVSGVKNVRSVSVGESFELCESPDIISVATSRTRQRIFDQWRVASEEEDETGQTDIISVATPRTRQRIFDQWRVASEEEDETGQTDIISVATPRTRQRIFDQWRVASEEEDETGQTAWHQDPNLTARHQDPGQDPGQTARHQDTGHSGATFPLPSPRPRLDSYSGDPPHCREQQKLLPAILADSTPQPAPNNPTTQLQNAVPIVERLMITANSPATTTTRQRIFDQWRVASEEEDETGQTDIISVATPRTRQRIFDQWRVASEEEDETGQTAWHQDPDLTARHQDPGQDPGQTARHQDLGQTARHQDTGHSGATFPLPSPRPRLDSYSGDPPHCREQQKLLPAILADSTPQPAPNNPTTQLQNAVPIVERLMITANSPATTTTRQRIFDQWRVASEEEDETGQTDIISVATPRTRQRIFDQWRVASEEEDETGQTAWHQDPDLTARHQDPGQDPGQTARHQDLGQTARHQDTGHSGATFPLPSPRPRLDSYSGDPPHCREQQKLLPAILANSTPQPAPNNPTTQLQNAVPIVERLMITANSPATTTVPTLSLQMALDTEIHLQSQLDQKQTVPDLQRQASDLRRQASETECNYRDQLDQKQQALLDLQRRASETEHNLRSQMNEENQLHMNEIETVRDELYRLRLQSSSSEMGFWNVPRGDVKIDKEIGVGGWGSVSKGMFHGRAVAIKQLHSSIVSSDNISRLRREVCLMANIRHPNILLFIAAVFDEAVDQLRPPLIVLELLDVDLRKAYKANMVGPRNYTSIFCDVACALNYLHCLREPIIHRDLSAPNVLLEAMPNNRWKAKVSDFGSANLARLAQTAAEGAIIYLAPECLPEDSRGPDAPNFPQTPKIDVYSYGVLLCEVMTHTLPTHLKPLRAELERKWPFMHGLANACTSYSPYDRPTFANILTKLQKFGQ